MSYSSDPQEVLAQAVTPEGQLSDLHTDLSGQVRVTDQAVYDRMGEVLQELRTLNKLVARFTMQELLLEDN